MSLNLKLDSVHSITSDSRNFILCKEDRPMWFFNNLDSLLKSYYLLKIRDSNAKRVEDLIVYVKSLEKASSRLSTSLKKQIDGLNDPEIPKEVKNG